MRKYFASSKIKCFFKNKPKKPLAPEFEPINPLDL